MGRLPTGFIIVTIPAYNFMAYLNAKKTVDDRALNRTVLQSLTNALPVTTPEKPVRVLEVAAGIGTMLERLLEWHVLNQVHYTALDLSTDCIKTAIKRLPDWVSKLGFQVEQIGATQFQLFRAQQIVTVQFETIDAFQFVEQEREANQQWDVLIAHAFWDLVDVSALLPKLLNLLTAQGLYYFSINFDGETILLPTIDETIDAQIINLYHQAMNDQHVHNKVGAGTRTGRHLFRHLASANTKLLNAGSSDWVVFPTEGGYPDDEAYFLHCIIHSMRMMLQDQLTPQIRAWLDERHAQIEVGKLIYIAHQLDFVGRVAS
ncbi:class I SAM-dependent methyltransferase [Anaerolineales bacterium HSG25]|nr:class I SAM-dependent methyltransferase [Anaerolineales bacterium HSG25]